MHPILASLGAALAAAASSASAQPVAGAPAAAAFVDAVSPAEARVRAWQPPAWADAEAAFTGASDVVWQELRVCSDWVRMALTTLDAQRVLRVRQWDGSGWGTPLPLAPDTGTHSTKVMATAFEHISGELLAVYRVHGSKALRFRTFETASPAESTLDLGLDAPARWITLASRPRSNEIAMIVATPSRLYGAVWDGSVWTGTAVLETSLASDGRAFDIAYMSDSGQAVAVWAAASGAAPKFRTWSGLTWGSVSTLPSLGAPARWITLAPNPARSSDEILLGTLDTGRDINLGVWNGLAWGAFTEVATEAGAHNEPRVAIAYQPDGQRALAVWHEHGQPVLRQRSWNGVSWSPAQLGPDMGVESQRVLLSPGREPTEIILGVRQREALQLIDYLAYSQSGTLDLDGVVVDGPTGEQIPGVVLPAPPNAAAGTGNLSYGHNSVNTVDAGSYRNLQVGNNAALNFSAGTYIFRSINIGNSPILNFNTAGGDIVLIVTDGDLQIDNTATFNNTGENRVTIHIVNGDLTSTNNNTIATDIDIYVYNGEVDLGNNCDIRGLVYATGDITIGSGSLITPPYYTGSPARASVAIFTDGVAGAVTQLASSVPGRPWADTLALTDRPPLRLPRVTGWTEIDPTGE